MTDPESGSGSWALSPDPKALATVEDLRLSELQGIHSKLGRVCKADRQHWWSRIEWDAVFGALAVLFFGGVIGGAIALVPFLASSPTHRTRIEYYAVLIVGFFLALLCVVARSAIRAERVASVAAIHNEVGEIVTRYEESLRSRTGADGG